MAGNATEEPGEDVQGAGGSPPDPFLTERRVVGLLGAALLATVGYWVATLIGGAMGYWVVERIGGLQMVLFFLVFATVFTGLNYALYRYD